MADYAWLIDIFRGRTNEPPRAYIKEAASAMETLLAQRDEAVSALEKFRASLDELHYQTAASLMADLSPDLRALVDAERERQEKS